METLWSPAALGTEVTGTEMGMGGIFQKAQAVAGFNKTQK